MEGILFPGILDILKTASHQYPDDQGAKTGCFDISHLDWRGSEQKCKKKSRKSKKIV
jgi:hypothetical protein